MLCHEHIHLPVRGKEEREEVQRRDFFLIKSRGISQMVLVVKNSSANAVDIRDTSLIPGLGRSPGGGHGNSIFFPGESHGQRSLAGYCLWGCKESDLTEGLWKLLISFSITSLWNELSHTARA